MILLDAPYVSDSFKRAVETLGQPVLDTSAAREVASNCNAAFIDAAEFRRRLEAGERVYANSENSLDACLEAAGDHDLARQVNICKDKAFFRETVAPLYPGYAFRRVPADELADLDVADMPCPFVVKPTRGFFSLGVHLVSCETEWAAVAAAIKAEREALNAEYPEAVVSGGEFILEQAIRGEEYAIDVYYDGDGEPVILNILHHVFGSGDDVSDRLYYTSSAVMEAWLERFGQTTRDIGRACGFRNFPMHLEVRVSDAGVIPIEANPLRFAGWCVADLTAHAWGFCPYEAYFSDLRPDWPSLIAAHRGQVACMVIGEIPHTVDRTRITRVDYDGFCAQFDEIVELRKMDWRDYPLFAMAFARFDESVMDRLLALASADFSRYIRTDQP